MSGKEIVTFEQFKIINTALNILTSGNSTTIFSNNQFKKIFSALNIIMNIPENVQPEEIVEALNNLAKKHEPQQNYDYQALLTASQGSELGRKLMNDSTLNSRVVAVTKVKTRFYDNTGIKTSLESQEFGLNRDNLSGHQSQSTYDIPQVEETGSKEQNPVSTGETEQKEKEKDDENDHQLDDDDNLSLSDEEEDSKEDKMEQSSKSSDVSDIIKLDDTSKEVEEKNFELQLGDEDPLINLDNVENTDSKKNDESIAKKEDNQSVQDGEPTDEDYQLYLNMSNVSNIDKSPKLTSLLKPSQMIKMPKKKIQESSSNQSLVSIDNSKLIADVTDLMGRMKIMETQFKSYAETTTELISLLRKENAELKQNYENVKTNWIDFKAEVYGQVAVAQSLPCSNLDAIVDLTDKVNYLTEQNSRNGNELSTLRNKINAETTKRLTNIVKIDKDQKHIPVIGKGLLSKSVSSRDELASEFLKEHPRQLAQINTKEAFKKRVDKFLENQFVRDNFSKNEVLKLMIIVCGNQDDKILGSYFNNPAFFTPKSKLAAKLAEFFEQLENEQDALKIKSSIEKQIEPELKTPVSNIKKTEKSKPATSTPFAWEDDDEEEISELQARYMK